MVQESNRPEGFDTDECRLELDRFYRRDADAPAHARAVKVLRLLGASEAKQRGKPSGWAAGIICYIANRDRTPCGVPGMLNSAFTAFFDVSMETVRRRAAAVACAVEI